ncbi:extracellular solute-binding protein [Paenibacillus tarimensis]
MTIRLKGITWNHTRGYIPMVAASQRFMETHPGVDISWDKRSLQEFADFPIQSLTDRYDLLVIDHPWAGYAAEKKVLVPLNEQVAESFLEDQSAHSVGGSHSSYCFNGFQSALAIDAAAPVAAWRPDLLAQRGEPIPQSWADLLAMARSGGVLFPAIPIDSLMNWYMMCIALGEEPFHSREQIVSPDTGTLALEHLRELASLCGLEIFGMNPIAVYEALSSRDDFVYCPFAYGYSNYARPGYARHVLEFGDLVEYERGRPLRSTLGGTGIAVSAGSGNVRVAVEYAMFVAGPVIQRTLYVECGGQPGHSSAWRDRKVNERCGGYFAKTLPALERAYVRPRYNGYLYFQDHAGDNVREYMQSGGNAPAVLDRMNELYRKSFNM